MRSTLLPIQPHTSPKGEPGGVTTIYSVDNVVRSTLLPIQPQTGPKGETGGVTTIYSVDKFFDIFDDLNLLNIIKVSYRQVSYTKLLKP